MALLWARIPALTTLVEVGFDIAVICTRIADGIGIIARALDLLAVSLYGPEVF